MLIIHSENGSSGQKSFKKGRINHQMTDSYKQFKEEKGKRLYSVFTAYSAQPALCLSSTPAA